VPPPSTAAQAAAARAAEQEAAARAAEQEAAARAAAQAAAEQAAAAQAAAAQAAARAAAQAAAAEQEAAARAAAEQEATARAAAQAAAEQAAAQQLAAQQAAAQQLAAQQAAEQAAAQAAAQQAAAQATRAAAEKAAAEQAAAEQAAAQAAAQAAQQLPTGRTTRSMDLEQRKARGYTVGESTKEEKANLKFLQRMEKGRELAKKKAKIKLGGGLKDVSVGPNDLIQLIAKQRSWEKVNSAYNDLEPEVKKLFPEPSSPPLYNIVEPFDRYINENADPKLLEEADEYSKLMSPVEIKEVFFSNGPALNRLLPFYKLALPKVSSEWMPNIIRAHLMRIL
jgi:hypothetical protein